MDLKSLTRRVQSMIEFGGGLEDTPTKRGVTKPAHNEAQAKRRRKIAKATKQAQRRLARKNNSLYSRKGRRK